MGVTRVRAADGTRWVVRRRAFVWPRWRAVPLGPLDGADFANLGDLFVVDSAASLVISIAVAVALLVVGTALVFVLLPGIVFVLELLVLPFFVLLFRGARVVEARNETTGAVLRFPVHGRAEARERERSLAAELGSPAPR